MTRPSSLLRPVWLALLSLTVLPIAHGAAWEATVPPYAPGSFAEMRPAHLQYGFGWNGASVATAAFYFHRAAEHLVLEGTAQTTGIARRLWQFDLEHHSVVDAHTLRPIRVTEVEKRKSKQFDTEVNYTADVVSSRRVEQKDGKTKLSERSFQFPGVMSMTSAMLYLRSKQLSDGASERVVVFPARTPYLCTVTVLGYERLTVPAGTYDAIKCDVKLSKIGDNRELKPHKKFKRATVWLSHDADRLLLRIEAQIFIGTVYTELQSVQFDAKP